MKNLSDLVNEKCKQVGGKAALGRMLGVSGQAIGQYINGSMPSIEIGFRWKRVFNENLVNLIFEDNSEPSPLPPHLVGATPDETIELLEEELKKLHYFQLALKEILREL